MNDFDFGAFLPYIEDEEITDINYNGRTLWIDHLRKGRYVEEDFYSQESIEQFCHRFANHCNCSFNPSHPIIENETKELRFSILHDSISKNGFSVSIRKTPSVMRLKKDTMIQSDYASQALISLFEVLIQAKCNILICGLPGAGKTELVKYLTSFIPGQQRVITIEDTLELRYGEIHPYKDSVSMKVHPKFTYVDAIKASLRQRPDWLLLSEVRSHEVVQLLESVSTGAKLISTLHADHAKSIPMRLLHMFPGVEMSNEVLLHNIYQSIDIGIHVESSMDEDGIHRYIKEIVCYDIDEQNQIVQHLLYHRVLQPTLALLPSKIQNKLIVGKKRVRSKRTEETKILASSNKVNKAKQIGQELENNIELPSVEHSSLKEEDAIKSCSMNEEKKSISVVEKKVTSKQSGLKKRVAELKDAKQKEEMQTRSNHSEVLYDLPNKQIKANKSGEKKKKNLAGKASG